MEEKKSKFIEDRANLSDIIRYASCWEDADILMEAIAPKKGGNYLSIASAGDNSFAFLTKNPALVLAIDLNPSQLACTELKKEAFRKLNYEQLLQFLGVHEMNSRRECYLTLRDSLSPSTRQFWDSRPEIIEQGIIHGGKFEDYFRLFRKWCLPFIHSQRTINRLLTSKNEKERCLFYKKTWDNLRWKLLFRLFFSRRVMGKKGRDPEFFKYVETNVASRILTRVEHALTHLPTDTNPYLEYILKGNFDKALPFYLRKENFELIKQNLNQLTLFHGGLKEAFASNAAIKFDGFNLSDIFEYMTPDQYTEELEGILNASQPDARIAFWNMLAKRKEVSSLHDRIDFLNEKADALHKQDKAFFYQAFILGKAK